MGLSRLVCLGITDGERAVLCVVSDHYGVDLALCYLDAHQARPSSLMNI